MIRLGLIFWFVWAGLAKSLDPSEMLDDPVLEAQARELDHAMRCVVCQSESVASSNARWAIDTRRVIREQVAEFGNLTIVSVPTVNQLTDLGTKALAPPRFEYLVRKVFNIAPDRSLRTTATVDMTADSQVHPTIPTPASRHTDSTEVPVRRLPTTFKRLRPTLENKFRVGLNGCNGENITRSTAAAV